MLQFALEIFSIAMAVTRSAALKASIIASRHPQYGENFRCGLASVLRQWTALELAIVHEWGGPYSREKAVNLENEIFNIFNAPDIIYKDDIALLLDEYMEDNFNATCEDGSTDEIGDLLVSMWRQCIVGDITLVSSVVSRESARVGVVSQSTGIDSEDVDEEMEGQLEEQGSSFAVDGEMMLETIAEEEPSAPMVDEEGFMTVFRGKKAGKKKG
jgi:hypothetical protein